jgi:hypothetical protein
MPLLSGMMINSNGGIHPAKEDVGAGKREGEDG